MTFLVIGPLGLFAGRLSGWIRGRPAALVWLNRASGTILLALGLRMAFTERV